jgi:hypothetical protein
MQNFRGAIYWMVHFNKYLLPKNFIDNRINRPQYLESVMLLIQNIGTIRSWALRHDVQGKIVQEE